MWRFASSGSCVRNKKPLAVTIITLVIIALFYSWVTLDSSLDKYGSARLPKLLEWLGNSDSKLNTDDSFIARKQLGNNIHSLFTKFRPPTSRVNKTFLEKWPPMASFQLKKKYDYSQVVAASANFFLDDAAYDSFRTQQQAIMEAIPKWESVSRGYSGRGVVVCAGSVDLERVWPNVALMLRSLESSLPIEVWTKDQEEYDRTLSLVDDIKSELKISISAHNLADYIPIVWTGMPMSQIFKVKALALLFTSFEEVMLFDSDSIPVMDPDVLFDSDKAKSGLIQWLVSNSLPYVYIIFQQI